MFLAVRIFGDYKSEIEKIYSTIFVGPLYEKYFDVNVPVLKSGRVVSSTSHQSDIERDWERQCLFAALYISCSSTD